MWHPDKKQKNHHTYDTQLSLYSVFTPVYSGITLALLTPQKFFPYVTQVDHPSHSQNSGNMAQSFECVMGECVI